MKITNLYNLPDAFTHLAEDGGERLDAWLSVAFVVAMAEELKK
jgi:hypothetical protein